MVMDYLRFTKYPSLLIDKRTSPLSDEEFASLSILNKLFTASKWTALFSIPIIYRLASLKSDQPAQRVKQLSIAQIAVIFGVCSFMGVTGKAYMDRVEVYGEKYGEELDKQIIDMYS
ncbi:hypothetical protein FGO68_gene10403 [Halteria grandinella]|uniref:Uncharacterized protein n=1 Tax=Halteria grandinella TaxID=5974 RepID=A0A8J8NPZ1_HALGN|nr:hypothetical protein FGO68_gene10403 [Halteria grandinella]